MPNFWALPPEINSTRIYLGPGSGPILAAAQGWNALASELEKTKVGLQSALDTLLESYRGQSSQALIQQTLPYVQWLTTTAEHAHKTAIQLTAAANAYEQARAAMVPPAMVRANRVQTTVLKAINWFGQFSTRIADKEADYEQMWFQDALVMENYWEAVQEAIQSTSHFEDPPEIRRLRRGLDAQHRVRLSQRERKRGGHPSRARREQGEGAHRTRNQGRQRGDHQTRLRWGAHVFIQGTS